VAAHGVALAEESGVAYRHAPTIASDGAGGAIVAWQDDGGGGLFDILARRVNAAGAPQWEEPVIVCAAAWEQVAPTTISDGAGGAIITWQDRRNVATIDDIYAQRLNGSGVAQWMPNGVAVCTAAVDQWTPLIVSDSGGGAVIAWPDRRTAATTQFDIFALRIDPDGLVPTAVRGSSPTPSLIVGNIYPNPFSAATSMDLWLEAPTDVRIELVDVAGRRVSEMMLREVPGGSQRVELDGRDGRGRRLANGVYFCRVTAAGTVVTRKMVIAR